jgi:hypothetical protein
MRSTWRFSGRVSDLVVCPALDAVSDAALIFYGGSMLLAAARDYAGLLVTHVSRSVNSGPVPMSCLPTWAGFLDARNPLGRLGEYY